MGARQSFREMTCYTRFRGCRLVQFDTGCSRQVAHVAVSPHQAEYAPHVGVPILKTLTRTLVPFPCVHANVVRENGLLVG